MLFLLSFVRFLYYIEKNKGAHTVVQTRLDGTKGRVILTEDSSDLLSLAYDAGTLYCLMWDAANGTSSLAYRIFEGDGHHWERSSLDGVTFPRSLKVKNGKAYVTGPKKIWTLDGMEKGSNATVTVGEVVVDVEGEPHGITSTSTVTSSHESWGSNGEYGNFRNFVT